MTAVPLAFYPDTNQWLPTESDSAFLEDFGTGVGLGDVTKDTSALQAAMAAGARISGRAGVPFYYIGAGAVCASGAFLQDIVLRAKHGTGGFNVQAASGGSGRYAQDSCVLNWNNADGGGYSNLEIYGDAAGARGKDYQTLALAVNGGMTTKPFVGYGRLYAHHLAGINGTVVLNSIGPAGYTLDTVELYEINTSLPKASWGNPAFVQVTGFGLDADLVGGVFSARGTIRQIVAPHGRIYVGGAARAEGGDQSDMITFAISTLDDAGPIIDTVYYHGVNGEDNVGEVIDSFACGVNIDRVIGYNVASAVFKTGNGGQRANIRSIYGENVGRYTVVIYAGSTVPTEQINIQSVTGKGVGGFFLHTGTLQAADATHATLASSASPVDGYFAANSQIVITGGAAVGSKGVVTAYNGTTKVLTVASWSAGTPNATSTYGMQVTTEARAVDFQAGDVAGIFDCTVNVDGVLDTGYMDEIVRNNMLASVSRGNRVVINNDLGFQGRASLSFFNGPVQVYAGAGQRAVTRLKMAAAQVITGGEVQLNFDTVDVDTSVGGRVNGVQSLNVASEKGIRVRLPGPKQIRVALQLSALPDGDRTTVRLKRAGSTIAQRVFRSSNSAAFGVEMTHSVFHRSEWYGTGTESLYTVTVDHSTGAAVTYDNVALNTYFEIEG